MTTTNGHLANADQLFAPRERRHREIVLPVSRNRVRIQSLTEREVSHYQAVAFKKNGSGLIPARIRDAGPRLMVLCAVDQAGNRILNDSHVAKFDDWDNADSAFLHSECLEHCGIRSDEDIELAVEGAAKNSSETGVEG
jgi:hypothetical protein